MKLSTEAHDILKAAVNGHYEQDFFGSVDASAKIEAAANVQRLRAVIQHLNLDFAKQMRLYGQKYKIGKPKGKLALEEADCDDELQPDSDAVLAEKVAQSTSTAKSIDAVFEGEDLTIQEACPAGFPKLMTRDQAVEWVLGVLQRSRGRELPGTFNPMLIGQLFWEQSSHWEAMALAHIERVAAKCNRFVSMVLSLVWLLKTLPPSCPRSRPTTRSKLVFKQVKQNSSKSSKTRQVIQARTITITRQRFRNCERGSIPKLYVKLQKSHRPVFPA